MTVLDRILRKVKGALKILTDSDYRFLSLAKYQNYYYGRISDAEYLERRYRILMGSELHLANPITFNEKINYLKLFDRKPIYQVMADKFAAKDFVGQVIGSQYVVPTLGRWERASDVSIDDLPEKFVIKTNHDSGTVIICRSRNDFDLKAAKRCLNKAMQCDFWLRDREWCYKDIKRCIFAEPYLKDSQTGELRDYKFFCFNGEPRFFKVDFGRFVSHRANYYDLNMNQLPYGEAAYPPDPIKKIEFPDNLYEMVGLARKLAQGTFFLRVDFYSADDVIYFGEMTFYPMGGLHKFIQDSQDVEIGKMLRLV